MMLLLVVFLFSLATSREQVCVYQDPQGYFYDLSPLSKCDQSGWTYNKDWSWTINICNSVTNVGCGAGTAVCQSGFDCGHADNSQFYSMQGGNGLILAYFGGDTCPNGVARQTILTFYCNRTATTPVFDFVAENPTCTYRFNVQSAEACPRARVAPQINGCPVKVFLVPHTHDDVGWLMTIEGYYQTQVKHIIDTAVSSLIANPKRKFIYVEQAYFYRWWTDPNTSDQQRANLRKLVANNQWEFVIGGWVMQDEACTTFGADIDQMTLGHQFLFKTFGVRPSKGWQVDPFGASSVTPILNKLSGFDAHLIDRITDKGSYQDDQTLEFLWNSRSLGSKSQIFTEIMAPGGYCDWLFDFNFGNDPVTPFNVESYGRKFLEDVDERLPWYKTSNVLAEWGCDFAFQNATAMFHSMDQVVDWLQKHYNETFVDVKYTTLSEYYASVWADAKTHNVSFPVDNGGDFLPYNSGGNNWWTGYYTSRTQLKGWVRRGESHARVIEGLFAFGRDFLRFNHDNVFKSMNALRFANAEAQHHDGVTGTSVPEVVLMYQNHLLDGINQTMASASEILNLWIKASATQSPNLVHGVEILKTLRAGQSVALVTFNSLGWPQDEMLVLPVNSRFWTVTDANGNPVPSQVGPAQSGNITSLYHLVFQANGTPALGYQTFFIQSTGANELDEREILETPKVTVESQKREAEQSVDAPIVLENSILRVTFDGTTNRISSVLNKKTNTLVQVNQNLMQYASQGSGAYVFAPTGAAFNINGMPTTGITSTGVLYTEVFQSFSAWANQSVRLYQAGGNENLEGFVEIIFSIGPLPSHTEVISSFTTDISSAGILYNDNNGYEFLARSYNFQNPIAANYYPMIYASYIQDSWSQLTLFSERSHGVSSQSSGHIEVMLHRNPDRGDGFGPGLTDTDTVYPVLRLGVNSPMNFSQVHSQPFSMNFPQTRFTALANANWNSFQTSGSLLKKAFPKNIHLISNYATDIYPNGVSCSSCVIIRLTHLYGTHEDPVLSQPVLIRFSDYFMGTIKSLTETTLTGNAVIQSIPSLQVTIQSKEIRTFVATF